MTTFGFTHELPDALCPPPDGASALLWASQRKHDAITALLAAAGAV